MSKKTLADYSADEIRTAEMLTVLDYMRNALGPAEMATRALAVLHARDEERDTGERDTGDLGLDDPTVDPATGGAPVNQLGTLQPQGGGEAGAAARARTTGKAV